MLSGFVCTLLITKMLEKPALQVPLRPPGVFLRRVEFPWSVAHFPCPHVAWPFFWGDEGASCLFHSAHLLRTPTNWDRVTLPLCYGPFSHVFPRLSDMVRQCALQEQNHIYISLEPHVLLWRTRQWAGLCCWFLQTEAAALTTGMLGCLGNQKHRRKRFCASLLSFPKASHGPNHIKIARTFSAKYKSCGSEFHKIIPQDTVHNCKQC